MRVRPSGAVFALCLLAAAIASAQAPATEKTRRLTAGATSPPATVTDMAWLAGRWTGTGLGGEVEEIWSPPQAGAMMGMFRLLREGATVFCELMTLVEENGSLVLRVKHFGPDLTGWEEKGETVDFPLVRVAGDRFYFDGLTFHRHDDDAISIHVVFSTRDGAVREETLSYTRARGQAQPSR
jgi:hypothetical protein